MTGLSLSLCFSSHVLGLEHPSVAESYNNLALVTCDMRADAEALQFSEKCMSIARKYYAPDHPQFLNYLGNAAIVLVGGHAEPGVQP